MRADSLCTWLASVACALVAGCLCPGGQVLCDGDCVDLSAGDPAHCGACGHACASTEQCDGDRCVPTPTCGPGAPMPVACDDGDPCNGVYECISGSCQRTEPAPSCRDGFSCTVDTCDPTSGCHQDPDDTLCDEGMICDPENGCVVRCDYAPCSAAAQCGCAENQTCAVLSSDEPTCTRPGTVQLGMRCPDPRQCASGLVCLGLGSVDGSRCSVPCDDDDDCDGVCFRSFGEETLLSSGERVGRCEQICDPVDSTGCGARERCDDVTSTAGGEGTFCREAGPGLVGSTCSDRTDCTRGHTCVRFTSGSQCGRLCHDDSDCPSSQDCLDFTTPRVVRGRRVGVCN